MAWTHYHYPANIEYYAEGGTGWVDTQGGLSTFRNIIMIDGLVGNATSSGAIVASDCRALLLSGFGIQAEAGTLAGIELVTQIDRGGRVIDQTVQLAQGRELIGRNMATDTVTDLQVYGGADNLWGTENLNYTSADFGLVLDLRPNPVTPSSERPIIRDIRIRLYFA